MRRVERNLKWTPKMRRDVCIALLDGDTLKSLGDKHGGLTHERIRHVFRRTMKEAQRYHPQFPKSRTLHYLPLKEMRADKHTWKTAVKDWYKVASKRG